MSTDGEERHAVILKHAADIVPQRQAGPLAKALKIPFYDAARKAKTCHGIPVKNFGETAAAELASHLRAAGIECEVVPSESVAVLRDAKPADKIEFSSGGIAVHTAGEVEEIQLSSMKLIAAGEIETTSMKTTVTKTSPGLGKKLAGLGIMMTTGIPVGMGKSKKVTRTERSTDVEYLAEFFAGEPDVRFAITPEKFDFTCLGEKMLPNLYGNFRLLISQMAKAAPGAALNEGAKQYMASGIGKPVSYGSREDFEAELVWLLTLGTLKI